MRFVTLIIYILIGALVAWFAAQNWDRTPLWLPGGYEAYWPLGAYVIAALLLGIIPLSLLHSVTRWRLKRRIAKLEARLADIDTGGAAARASLARERDATLAEPATSPTPSLDS